MLFEAWWELVRGRNPEGWDENRWRGGEEREELWVRQTTPARH